MEEWKHIRLGDVISIKSGFAYKGECIGEGDSYLLGMGCVSYKDIFLPSGARKYNGEVTERYLAKPGDIVLATRQQSDNLPILGMPAMIPDSFNEKKVIIGANLYRVENQSEISNEFLFWLLKSPAYVAHIRSCQTGTTVRMITKANIEDFTFLCPPKLERQKIASTLWNYEKKIELNNRINHNLEEQAQALYKSWFVDFEPFKGGKFVDSELGMIPEGWSIDSIGKLPLYITDYVSNGSFASLKENVTLYEHREYAHFVRNTDLKSGVFPIYVDKRSFEFLSKSKLNGGEIIISNVGDVGSVFICPQLEGPMTLGNNVIMVKPMKDFLNYYLYILFKWFDGKNKIKNITGGSAMPKFNKTDFKSLPVILPTEHILSLFHKLVKPLFDEIAVNNDTVKRLSGLRDSMLPKLMSGELNINDFDC